MFYVYIQARKLTSLPKNLNRLARPCLKASEVAPIYEGFGSPQAAFPAKGIQEKRHAMTNPPASPPGHLPDDSQPEPSPGDAPTGHVKLGAELYDDLAETDLIGAVLYDEEAFEMASLKATDFYLHRHRWIWEAFTAIRGDNDHIDYNTLEKYLAKSGHLQDVTSRHCLEYFFTPTLLHVPANARTVLDLAERRGIVARATELVKRTCNLDIPLPKKPEPIQTRWTQEQLAAAEFPEPDGPVPGLIPNGLTILGGRPKRGKSWLMLQAGCSLATGGKFLEHDLRLGKVLYYALEDRPRRLKDRTAKLGIPGYALIEYELSVKPLHLGGMAAIEQAARHGGYTMLVIDTIRRALPGKDFNKDGALFDDILSQLQSLAQQTYMAIVAILHTRKGSAGFEQDPVDDVLGSTGLTASADQVLALYTEQGKKGATLKGRGRDLDDIDLALQFDPLTCAWQSLGETSEAKNTELENEIIAVLEEFGKTTIATIAKTVGKDFSNTRRKLMSMWTSGKVKKEEIENKMYYCLPARSPGNDGSHDQSDR